MPPKKKAKKDEQIKDPQEAQKVILEYLKEQFRPYSMNDIYLNLHSKISKTVALKALTALVEQDLLLMKTYGKLNFYVFKYPKEEQEEAVNTKGNPITLETIQQLAEEHEALSKEVKDLSNELKTITSEPDNAELQSIDLQLIKEIEVLKSQKANLEDKLKDAVLDPHQLDSIAQEIKKTEKHCKSRKRDYFGIVALLKENVPTYKTILEKAGIEDYD